MNKDNQQDPLEALQQAPSKLTVIDNLVFSDCEFCKGARIGIVIGVFVYATLVLVFK